MIIVMIIMSAALMMVMIINSNQVRMLTSELRSPLGWYLEQAKSTIPDACPLICTSGNRVWSTFSFSTFFPNRGYILSKTQMWSKILDLSICEEDCWEDLHLLQQAQILGKSFVQTDSDLFSVSAPPTKICVYICACTCFGIVLISVPMYFDTCCIVDKWYGW